MWRNRMPRIRIDDSEDLNIGSASSASSDGVTDLPLSAECRIGPWVAM
jgi:hypothetical protein